MNAACLLCVLLIVAGAGLLAYSLVPTSRILSELPKGSAVVRWRILRGLIAFFLAGYLLYLFLAPQTADPGHLLVSAIFFFGACFVLLICTLALGTVRDVTRISTLEAENVTDPLMEIYNRRYFDRCIEQEFARAVRYGLPLSLVLLDIDHFKRINDTFGHLAGDMVLKGIGALLKANVRGVDIPARYGGEEVVVVLPHTDGPAAAVLAERLRKKVEEHPFPARAAGVAGGTFRCTVSVGVASIAQDCADARRLVELADAAMYQAKQQGRNRVVRFTCGAQHQAGR